MGNPGQRGSQREFWQCVIQQYEQRNSQLLNDQADIKQRLQNMQTTLQVLPCLQTQPIPCGFENYNPVLNGNTDYDPRPVRDIPCPAEPFANERNKANNRHDVNVKSCDCKNGPLGSPDVIYQAPNSHKSSCLCNEVAENINEGPMCNCKLEQKESEQQSNGDVHHGDVHTCFCNNATQSPTAASKPDQRPISPQTNQSLQSCSCTSEASNVSPLQNLDNMSIGPDDMVYVEKVRQLLENEKKLKKEVEDLNRAEKCFNQRVKRRQAYSESSGSGDYEVQNLKRLNEKLEESNNVLETEIEETMANIKQLRENVEEPMKREIEAEKKKIRDLEEEFRRRQGEVEIKRLAEEREMELVRNQLQHATQYLSDLNIVNKRLKEELCMLNCRCNELQTDIINQKLSEIHTISRLYAQKRRFPDHVPSKHSKGSSDGGDDRGEGGGGGGRHSGSRRSRSRESESRGVSQSSSRKSTSVCPKKKPCPGKPGDKKGGNDLDVIAQNLSALLAQATECNTCQCANPDLIDTVKCIKDLVDMVNEADKSSHASSETLSYCECTEEYSGPLIKSGESVPMTPESDKGTLREKPTKDIPKPVGKGVVLPSAEPSTPEDEMTGQELLGVLLDYLDVQLDDQGQIVVDKDGRPLAADGTPININMDELGFSIGKLNKMDHLVVSLLLHQADLLLDEDGLPVLDELGRPMTPDGIPISIQVDEEGKPILDESGRLITPSGRALADELFSGLLNTIEKEAGVTQRSQSEDEVSVEIRGPGEKGEMLRDELGRSLDQEGRPIDVKIDECGNPIQEEPVEEAVQDDGDQAVLGDVKVAVIDETVSEPTIKKAQPEEICMAMKEPEPYPIRKDLTTRKKVCPPQCLQKVPTSKTVVEPLAPEEIPPTVLLGDDGKPILDETGHFLDAEGHPLPTDVDDKSALLKEKVPHGVMLDEQGRPILTEEGHMLTKSGHSIVTGPPSPSIKLQLDEQGISVVDEQGRPVMRADGMPLDVKLDEHGEPILDAQGHMQTQSGHSIIIAPVQPDVTVLLDEYGKPITEEKELPSEVDGIPVMLDEHGQPVLDDQGHMLSKSGHPIIVEPKDEQVAATVDEQGRPVQPDGTPIDIMVDEHGQPILDEQGHMLTKSGHTITVEPTDQQVVSAVDEQGRPLKSDGTPIEVMLDEQGQPILDEQGHMITKSGHTITVEPTDQEVVSAVDEQGRPLKSDGTPVDIMLDEQGQPILDEQGHMITKSGHTITVEPTDQQVVSAVDEQGRPLKSDGTPIDVMLDEQGQPILDEQGHMITKSGHTITVEPTDQEVVSAVDEQGRPLKSDGTPVDIMLDEQGQPILDEQGHMITKSGHTITVEPTDQEVVSAVDEQGRPLKSDGTPIDVMLDEQGQPILDEQGHMITKSGHTITVEPTDQEVVSAVDEQGRPLKSDGTPIDVMFDEQGQPILDEQGHMLTKSGHAITAEPKEQILLAVDDQGRPLKSDGTPIDVMLDEDGNPVLDDQGHMLTASGNIIDDVLLGEQIEQDDKSRVDDHGRPLMPDGTPVDIILDENGQPILDEYGHMKTQSGHVIYLDEQGAPIVDESAVPSGLDGKPISVIAEEDKTQLFKQLGIQFDENGQPILDEKGRPLQADGTPIDILLDEHGRPVLDSQGNLLSRDGFVISTHDGTDLVPLPEAEALTNLVPSPDVEPVRIISRSTEGDYVTTAAAAAGLLHVTTEGPAGLIDTTVKMTDSGHFQVLTDMTEFEEEGFIDEQSLVPTDESSVQAREGVVGEEAYEPEEEEYEASTTEESEHTEIDEGAEGDVVRRGYPEEETDEESTEVESELSEREEVQEVTSDEETGAESPLEADDAARTVLPPEEEAEMLMPPVCEMEESPEGYIEEGREADVMPPICEMEEVPEGVEEGEDLERLLPLAGEMEEIPEEREEAEMVMPPVCEMEEAPEEPEDGHEVETLMPPVCEMEESKEVLAIDGEGTKPCICKSDKACQCAATDESCQCEDEIPDEEQLGDQEVLPSLGVGDRENVDISTGDLDHEKGVTKTAVSEPTTSLQICKPEICATGERGGDVRWICECKKARSTLCEECSRDRDRKCSKIQLDVKISCEQPCRVIKSRTRYRESDSSGSMSSNSDDNYTSTRKSRKKSKDSKGRPKTSSSSRGVCADTCENVGIQQNYYDLEDIKPAEEDLSKPKCNNTTCENKSTCPILSVKDNASGGNRCITFKDKEIDPMVGNKVKLAVKSYSSDTERTDRQTNATSCCPCSKETSTLDMRSEASSRKSVSSKSCACRIKENMKSTGANTFPEKITVSNYTQPICNVATCPIRIQVSKETEYNVLGDRDKGMCRIPSCPGKVSKETMYTQDSPKTRSTVSAALSPFNVICGKPGTAVSSATCSMLSALSTLDPSCIPCHSRRGSPLKQPVQSPATDIFVDVHNLRTSSPKGITPSGSKATGSCCSRKSRHTSPLGPDSGQRSLVSSMCNPCVCKIDSATTTLSSIQKTASPSTGKGSLKFDIIPRTSPGRQSPSTAVSSAKASAYSSMKSQHSSGAYPQCCPCPSKPSSSIASSKYSGTVSSGLECTCSDGSTVYGSTGGKYSRDISAPNSCQWPQCECTSIPESTAQKVDSEAQGPCEICIVDSIATRGSSFIKSCKPPPGKECDKSSICCSCPSKKSDETTSGLIFYVHEEPGIREGFSGFGDQALGSNRTGLGEPSERSSAIRSVDLAKYQGSESILEDPSCTSSTCEDKDKLDKASIDTTAQCLKTCACIQESVSTMRSFDDEYYTCIHSLGCSRECIKAICNYGIEEKSDADHDISSKDNKEATLVDAGVMTPPRSPSVGGSPKQSPYMSPKTSQARRPQVDCTPKTCKEMRVAPSHRSCTLATCKKKHRPAALLEEEVGKKEPFKPTTAPFGTVPVPGEPSDYDTARPTEPRIGSKEPSIHSKGEDGRKSPALSHERSRKSSVEGSIKESIGRRRRESGEGSIKESGERSRRESEADEARALLQKLYEPTIAEEREPQDMKELISSPIRSRRESGESERKDAVHRKGSFAPEEEEGPKRSPRESVDLAEDTLGVPTKDHADEEESIAHPSEQRRTSSEYKPGEEEMVTQPSERRESVQYEPDQIETDESGHVRKEPILVDGKETVASPSVRSREQQAGLEDKKSIRSDKGRHTEEMEKSPGYGEQTFESSVLGTTETEHRKSIDQDKASARSSEIERDKTEMQKLADGREYPTDTTTTGEWESQREKSIDQKDDTVTAHEKMAEYIPEGHKLADGSEIRDKTDIYVDEEGKPLPIGGEEFAAASSVHSEKQSERRKSIDHKDDRSVTSEKVLQQVDADGKPIIKRESATDAAAAAAAAAAEIPDYVGDISVATGDIRKQPSDGSRPRRSPTASLKKEDVGRGADKDETLPMSRIPEGEEIDRKPITDEYADTIRKQPSDSSRGKRSPAASIKKEDLGKDQDGALPMSKIPEVDEFGNALPPREYPGADHIGSEHISHTGSVPTSERRASILQSPRKLSKELGTPPRADVSGEPGVTSSVVISSSKKSGSIREGISPTGSTRRESIKETLPGKGTPDKVSSKIPVAQDRPHPVGCKCQKCKYSICECTDDTADFEKQICALKASEIEHPPTCTCIDCICDPAKFDKSQVGDAVPIHPPDCACVDCLCDPNKGFMKGKGAEIEATMHEEPCDCPECICAPCADETKGPLCASFLPPHHPDCTCAQCLCDECLHIPECKCEKCICNKCAHFSSLKNKCNCPICACAPCGDTDRDIDESEFQQEKLLETQIEEERSRMVDEDRHDAGDTDEQKLFDEYLEGGEQIVAPIGEFVPQSGLGDIIQAPMDQDRASETDRSSKKFDEKGRPGAPSGPSQKNVHPDCHCTPDCVCDKCLDIPACECEDFLCENCADETMAQKKREWEAQHSPDCNCVECKCDPCRDKTKGQTPICDCEETVICDDCNDKTAAQRKDEIRKQHPMDCNCASCKCNPCSDMAVEARKREQIQKCDIGDQQEDVCDCWFCMCKQCKDPRIRAVTNAPISSIFKNWNQVKVPDMTPLKNTLKRIVQHPADCKCHSCSCDPCKKDPFRSSLNTTHGPTCTCSSCVCDNTCTGKSGGAKRMPQKECNCDRCVCDPCGDPIFQTKRTLEKLKKDIPAQHVPNCDCPTCRCKPCKDPKHGGNCQCAECVCQPCPKIAPSIPPIDSRPMDLDTCECFSRISSPKEASFIKQASPAQHTPCLETMSTKRSVDKHEQSCVCPICVPVSTQHGPNCQCPQCVCKPCFDTRVETRKPVSDKHGAACICPICAPLPVNHGKGCLCPICAPIPASIPMSQQYRETRAPDYSLDKPKRTKHKSKTHGSSSSKGEHNRHCKCEMCSCPSPKRKERSRSTDDSQKKKKSKSHPPGCKCKHCVKTKRPEDSGKSSKYQDTLEDHRAFPQNVTDISRDNVDRRKEIEELEALMEQIRCSCDNAEVEAACHYPGNVGITPCPLKILDLQNSLINFKEQCETKDKIIETLTGELQAREDMGAAHPKQSAGPCGICISSPTLLQIKEVKRISSDSVLVKWTQPCNELVIGYEISIDNILRSRVHSAQRTSAVVFGVHPAKKSLILVHAITHYGRCDPPATCEFES